ncbi:unnamed protein product [Rangifer tarandus platyrhynchus]|uniref:Uncharacterized protein n=1 Tax=Rangifer tarandus platyrhynchus TaxID=3082113 RepID=A0ABN8YXC5_RANTA|nr:unnamed protein product [Rangifer tarandus platyrhynchus]
MEGTLNNILMIISAGEFLLGILGNGFIVLVNCIDWIRSRKFSLIDFILTCLATSRIFVLLAISRISLLCIILLDCYIMVLHTRRMQLRAPGSRDASTEAHVRAMKAVISFLLLFIAYYLAYLVATSSYFMPETELAVIVATLATLATSSTLGSLAATATLVILVTLATTATLTISAA